MTRYDPLAHRAWQGSRHLEEFYSVFQLLFPLWETLCLSHQPPNPLAQYSVEVLDVCGLHAIQIRIAINHSFDFANDFPLLSNFNNLTIVYNFSRIKFR